MFSMPEKLMRIAGLICGLGVSAVWTSFLGQRWIVEVDWTDGTIEQSVRGQ
jgi:hypothetical protein